MAIYRCAGCDNLKDGDYDVCSEDPRPESDNGLVCEDCMGLIEEEVEDSKLKLTPSFTNDQLDQIKKMEAEADDNS